MTEKPVISNTPEYSVSEISGALKKTVEQNFSHVRVRGELGRVVRAASGHVYVDLKDDKAVVNSILWRGVADKLSFRPEEGMEVVATGRLSTYAARSNYNLIIERMEIAGEGALMALLEKRKKALAGEGLFDPARKQKLPFLPQRIGVVTSRSGAVLRDILHRLGDRFPREVILWPVAVQGEPCASEVANAIHGFNAMDDNDPKKPDLIIVARGGGSIEDLWGFNEEIVVRAAAGSKIPLISAVGHETDTTLIDYAADQRAPTPTAAAEMAVPVRAELLANLADLDARRLRALVNLHENAARRLRDVARALPRPQRIWEQSQQSLDHVTTRLQAGIKRTISDARLNWTRSAVRLSSESLNQMFATKSREMAVISSGLEPAIDRRIADGQAALEAQSRLLNSLSYTRVLERGYAVLRDENGRIITNASQLKTAETFEVEQAGNQRTRAQIKGE